MPLNSHLGQPVPASRRCLLQGAAAAPLLLLPHAPRAHAASAAATKPVLDQPMRRQVAWVAMAGYSIRRLVQALGIKLLLSATMRSHVVKPLS